MNKTFGEWKKELVENELDKVKSFIQENKEFETKVLTEDQIIELYQEVEIEQFSEEVDFDGEIDLTEEYICEDTGVITGYDFVPEENGRKTDLTLELPAEYCTEGNLEAIQAHLFAESYDIIISEAGSNKGAKVVFKRSKGKIVKSKRCGKGFRLKGNRCIPQTGSQKAKNRMKGIRLVRAKRAMGAGKKKRAALKAKITKKKIKTRARNYAGTTN